MPGEGRLPLSSAYRGGPVDFGIVAVFGVAGLIAGVGLFAAFALIAVGHALASIPDLVAQLDGWFVTRPRKQPVTSP